MSELPNKVFFRRGEVRECLGCTDRFLTKLIEGGTLPALRLRGYKWAVFHRDDILRVRTATAVTGSAQDHEHGEHKTRL